MGPMVGSFIKRGLARSSAMDNGCDTIMPFLANLMAGLITLRRGNDPKSFGAVSNPWTLPGTPLDCNEKRAFLLVTL